MRRIAMWSGPRNISTALMRSFENRADTYVIDEPFYACFLKATGIDHPGRDLILKKQSTNFECILQGLTQQNTCRPRYIIKNICATTFYQIWTDVGLIKSLMLF